MKIQLTPLRAVGIIFFFGFVYALSIDKVHSFYNLPNYFTLMDLLVMGLICLGFGFTMGMSKKPNYTGVKQ